MTHPEHRKKKDRVIHGELQDRIKRILKTPPRKRGCKTSRSA